MVDPAQPLRMSVAEFLAWDPPGDARYELVGGRPVLMAPPKEGHGTIATNLAVAIATRLRPPCRLVQQAGIAIGEDDDHYEADMAVTCSAPRAGRQYLEEPRLVVEVLSPSTRNRDLGTKLDRYRELPSVEEVLLVSSTERRVTHWLREGDHWRVQDIIGRGSVTLALTDAELDLDAIYAGVAFGSEEVEP